MSGGLLPSNGRCLGSHYISMSLHATVFTFILTEARNFMQAVTYKQQQTSPTTSSLQPRKFMKSAKCVFLLLVLH
jgi:hypothetical protein